jgi:OmpA-OmpF porin, OOP family
MKLSRIALAMLVAAPFAAANAGVTVTPLMLGYHWYPEDTQEKMRDEALVNRNSVANQIPGTIPGGVALVDDLSVGAAIGLELTPWLQAEVEYQQTKADAQHNEDNTGPKNGPFANTNGFYAGVPYDAKHETLSGNLIATTDVFTGNYDSKVKPYALIGGGYSRITVDNPGYDYRSYDTIGNLGAGVLWQLNDALTLRTEARATHNFDNNWWEGQGIAALQVVLGGHLKPAAPVAPVEPIAPPPPPVVEPTPEPTPEPQQLTEDLKMELRVFFDTNKSNIKEQYKPEVAKVAQKLQEYPNATAMIEGHTDNTGPRKLNERLSMARANSVKSMLVGQYGIDGSRLTTQGYAWDRPIAPNNTKEGRAMNRRVYAVITGSRTVTVPADQVPTTAPAATATTE